MIQVLKIEIRGTVKINSISVASVIMILYNLFAWVSLVQNIRNSKQLTEIKSELERARTLLAPLDEVANICSTIRNTIGGKDIGE